MSILLDALKKSEAQRRLGATPTLDSPISGTRVHGAGGPRWVPVALVVLAAAAMTWFGWSPFQEAQEPEPATPVAAAEPVASGAPRAARAPEPGREIRIERPEPAGRSDAVDQKRRLLGTTFQSFTPTADDEADDGGESGRAREGLGEREVADVAETASSDTPAVTEVLAEDAAAGLARVQPSDGTGDDTISYWQLPGSVRSGMPELRIRVLVYAEQPVDRFLLINDLRLKEGEELEAGLRLEEIRRDRAVFSYRNYRFHLKG